MRLSEYCGKNGRMLELSNLKLYFSYETLIAFEHPDAGLVIRENNWGPTTGKHLNAINNDTRIRVPGNLFQQQWQEFAESKGLDASISI